MTIRRRKLVTWGSMRTCDMVTNEKLASLKNPKKACSSWNWENLIIKSLEVVGDLCALGELVALAILGWLWWLDGPQLAVLSWSRVSFSTYSVHPYLYYVNQNERTLYTCILYILKNGYQIVFSFHFVNYGIFNCLLLHYLKIAKVMTRPGVAGAVL